MCIFKKSKVSTPDTSVQEAEARRQREAEEKRWREQQAAEQARWEADRADSERRYAAQLAAQQAEAERQRAVQQAEIDRQAAAQQQAEAMREQERQEVLAQQQAKAQATREYSTGRQNLILKAEDDINGAYAGFDDGYFLKFADALIQQQAPTIEREAQDASRSAVMDGARKGNFKSTAQGRTQGKLAEKKAQAQATSAKSASDQASAFRSSVDGQKRDALSSLWSSGAAGSEILPDGTTDVGSALGGIGAQLGSLTQTTRNSAAKISNPFF